MITFLEDFKKKKKTSTWLELDKEDELGQSRVLLLAYITLPS